MNVQISDTWSDKQKPEKNKYPADADHENKFQKSHFSNSEQHFLTSNKGKQSTHTEQPDLFNQKNDPQKYFKQKNNV